MRNLLYRLTDTPVLHTSLEHRTRNRSHMSSGKEKLKSCCVFVSLYSRRNMAEARISVDQNEFTCPVCLDLLKDPVTIQCGHSTVRSVLQAAGIKRIR